jgi:hypothetical protein
MAAPLRIAKTVSPNQTLPHTTSQARSQQTKKENVQEAPCEVAEQVEATGGPCALARDACNRERDATCDRTTEVENKVV